MLVRCLPMWVMRCLRASSPLEFSTVVRARCSGVATGLQPAGALKKPHKVPYGKITPLQSEGCGSFQPRGIIGLCSSLPEASGLSEGLDTLKGAIIAVPVDISGGGGGLGKASDDRSPIPTS